MTIGQSRLWRIVPPLLLTSVAVIQIGLARTAGLTAWKGGGFGMFSTLDQGAYRGVDVVIEGPDRSEGMEIPPSLETAAARAAAFPGDRLLKALAEGVVDRERRYDRPVTHVKLMVWRAAFDRTPLRGVEQPIRTFVYEVPDSPQP